LAQYLTNTRGVFSGDQTGSNSLKFCGRILDLRCYWHIDCVHDDLNVSEWKASYLVQWNHDKVGSHPLSKQSVCLVRPFLVCHGLNDFGQALVSHNARGSKHRHKVDHSSPKQRKAAHQHSQSSNFDCGLQNYGHELVLRHAVHPGA
jgi:hypothetical protein